MRRKHLIITARMPVRAVSEQPPVGVRRLSGMMNFAFALMFVVSACSFDLGSHDDNSADAGNFVTVDAYQQGVDTVKHVFVTSALYEGGALGGIGGADAICQLHSDTAGLTDASGL